MTMTSTFAISDFAIAAEVEAAATKQITFHHHRPPLPSDFLVPATGGVRVGARQNQFSTFQAHTAPHHQLLPLLAFETAMPKPAVL